MNVPLLGQRHGITRQECITSCIGSKVSCGAINFRSIDGACEFLPYQTCMSLQETVETDGTNVVQLGQCDRVPPGIGLIKPTEHRLRWLPLSGKGSRDVIDLGSGRSVARVIYKGMYLSGFTNRRGAFKAFDMKRNFISCGSGVQYLTRQHLTILGSILRPVTRCLPLLYRQPSHQIRKNYELYFLEIYSLLSRYISIKN